MSTITQALDAGAGIPFNTAIPELVKRDGTNFPLFGYAFDATTDENIYFRFIAVNYGASNPNLTVLVDWESVAGSTTGGVVFGAAISVLTPGDAQSMETDAFATETTGTTASVNSTARGPNRTSITVSNLDSLTANDTVCIRIGRRPGNASDTMAGDALVVGFYVQYPDV